MNHSISFLDETVLIAQSLDRNILENMASAMAELRSRGGRLFVLGVGGSAANAAHAVNDFRKLCGIEAYAPTDNVSELTARTNDDGWETVFSEWLKVSKLSKMDAVLVFSVGGGNIEMNVSVNLVRALKYSKEVEAKILGVVGRDGGFTKQIGDSVLVVPEVNADMVTPHTEAFQAVIWHCIVSHPILQINDTKWQSQELTSKAVFLDRDGVLNSTRVENGKPYAPTHYKDFHLFEEALPATVALKKAGFLLVVVTNQPDVGNRITDYSEIKKMNEHLIEVLPIDRVKVCFHSQTDDCHCRKPRPGLLIETIEEYNIDPHRSFMIGDRWSDVQAGNAVNCSTIFLERGYREHEDFSADYVCRNLSEATKYILNLTRADKV